MEKPQHSAMPTSLCGIWTAVETTDRICLFVLFVFFFFMDLTKIGYVYVNWIELALDKAKCRGVLMMIICILVP
jgi:hypothetical protein